MVGNWYCCLYLCLWILLNYISCNYINCFLIQNFGRFSNIVRLIGVIICVIFKFVVFGFDDFNIYIWEVLDDWVDYDKVLIVGRVFMVFYGYRFIVN